MYYTLAICFLTFLQNYTSVDESPFQLIIVSVIQVNIKQSYVNFNCYNFRYFFEYLNSLDKHIRYTWVPCNNTAISHKIIHRLYSLILLCFCYLQEVISGQHLLKDESLAIVSSTLQVLIKMNSVCSLRVGSARVRFAFAILHCIASHIHPSVSSLEWLSKHGCEVVKLAESYRAISEIEACRFVCKIDEDTSDLLAGRYPEELCKFLCFIRALKNALETWSKKLHSKQMTFMDIIHMFELVGVFEKLASALLMPQDLIKNEAVISVREEYNKVEHRLSDLLLKSVHGHPELQW